jgi:phosphoglycolate phosphatase
MRFQYVLFDLDGTILKSEKGIYNALAYTMKKHHLPRVPEEEKRLFIGPPLHSSFMNMFHVSMEEADRMVQTYREYYNSKGKFESELYKGIRELLRDMKRIGYTLALTTSKIRPFAEEILRFYGVYNLFNVISAADLSPESSDKALIIQDALTRCGVTEKRQAIMVGDRMYDMEGAKKNGIESIGVLYGYGTRDELVKNGATYIVNSVSDLCTLFLTK